VGTSAEKWRAASDAWVNGVRSVDESRIDVRPWAERAGLVTVHYPRLSDVEIVRAIEDAARYDPRVEAAAIHPEVRAGFVTLRGIVDNLQAKRAAGALARHTVGVVQVENLVEVKSRVPLTDEERARRIRAALAIDPVTQPGDIEVVVVDGEATLSGNVENYYVAAEADRIAAGVHGISQVDDRLHVAHGGVGYAHRRSIGPFGSHFESWTWVPRVQARPQDGEIACDIQHELARSDLLDDDEVSVKVHDGVAMLTGTVDSWQQRYAATDRALEAGATAVFNSLLVE
jgi:osmotically-inducible protein OsmY